MCRLCLPLIKTLLINRLLISSAIVLFKPQSAIQLLTHKTLVDSKEYVVSAIVKAILCPSSPWLSLWPWPSLFTLILPSMRPVVTSVQRVLARRPTLQSMGTYHVTKLLQHALPHAAQPGGFPTSSTRNFCQLAERHQRSLNIPTLIGLWAAHRTDCIGVWPNLDGMAAVRIGYSTWMDRIGCRYVNWLEALVSSRRKTRAGHPWEHAAHRYDVTALRAWLCSQPQELAIHFTFSRLVLLLNSRRSVLTIQDENGPNGP